MNTKSVQHETVQPELIGHLGATHELMAAKGLPRSLSHLIELRVSQINECAYCIRMHSSEARKDGETSQRLDRLAGWRHMPDFTPAEKAVFAYAEALTILERGADYGALRAELRNHYDDETIMLITTCVSMINLWNRVQISKH